MIYYDFLSAKWFLVVQCSIGQYFLAKKGINCIGGKKITKHDLCKKACQAFSISIKWNEWGKNNNKPCFKHQSGDCRKNGKNEGGATLLCKQGKCRTKMYVFNMLSFLAL